MLLADDAQGQARRATGLHRRLVEEFLPQAQALRDTLALGLPPTIKDDGATSNSSPVWFCGEDREDLQGTCRYLARMPAAYYYNCCCC